LCSTYLCHKDERGQPGHLQNSKFATPRNNKRSSPLHLRPVLLFIDVKFLVIVL